MARSLRGAIDWLESRVGTRLGGTTNLRLRARGVRSAEIALPAIPGRDFGTYVGYYVQILDWHSVVPMAMLFRTPLAPLVIGGTLDLFGGWGARGDGAALRRFGGLVDAGSLAFGPRAAPSRSRAARYPGHGIRPHAASEPLAAATFAVGRSRSRVPGSPRRAVHVLGAATAVTALARPAFVSPSSRRCPSSSACRGAHGSEALPPAPASRSRSWARGRSRTVSVTTTTPSPGAGAFLPFYRTFTTDHIVRPETGRPRDSSQTRREPSCCRRSPIAPRDHAG